MAENEKEKAKELRKEKGFEKRKSPEQIEELKETLLDIEPGMEGEIEFEEELGFEEEPEEEGRAGEKATMPGPPKPKMPKAAVRQKQRVKAIETVLAQGFKDLYVQLPSNLKNEFKKKGEEAARKIDEIVVSSKKAKTSKILSIIKNWLSILKKIPGINRFFLEQEAKIKTDRIMKMRGEEEIDIFEK